MGKSQTRRLRNATKRFGREEWNRWASARAHLASLAFRLKENAGLISPTTAVARLAYDGPAAIQRYSTCLSHQQNEITYGRPLK